MATASARRPLAPIEAAKPDGLGPEKLPRPRLGPTLYVVGKFQAPAEVIGNPPDMSLIQDARTVLNYKTNYTLLEWWAIFPVGKWWRYAIEATKHFAIKLNYRYFLLCLKSAAGQSKVYQDCVDKLKHLAKVDLAREVYQQKVVRTVCQTCNGNKGGCEACDPGIVKVRNQANILGLKLECHDCQGAVCLRCLKRYHIEIAQAKDSPTMKLNFGTVPAPA